MNDTSSPAKQQIAEKVTNSKHILVTIPKNPSVDEMAAAVGLSLLLDKLDKRPNVIFSGKIPPAVSFLEPKKLFTQSIDGLRDFIVALDKEKADKLRWKVEDDIVKIFITPYKTALSDKDLTFSQGEFNVELVLALGVENNEELDNALKAQGKILHDASVMTLNAGNKSSSLGSVDWQDKSAGSICEMLVGISESFGSGLLDEQIATAFLTGIVANTNRFSNELTTPKVMTMAAQLMAAGANQQLIASNLGEPEELDEGNEANIKDAKNMPKKAPAPKESNNDAKREINLDHRARSGRQESKKRETEQPPSIEIPRDNAPSDNIASDDREVTQISDVKSGGQDAPQAVKDNADISKSIVSNRSHKQMSQPPTFGGTLNALNSNQPDSETMASELINNNSPASSLSHGDNEANNPVSPPTIPQVAASMDSAGASNASDVIEQAPQSPALAESPQEETNTDTSAEDYLEQARKAVLDASAPAGQSLPEPIAPIGETSSNIPAPEPMTNPDWDNSLASADSQVVTDPSVIGSTPPSFNPPTPTIGSPTPSTAMMPPSLPPLPPLPTSFDQPLPPLPTPGQPTEQFTSTSQSIIQPPQPAEPPQNTDPGIFPLPPMQ